LPFFAASLRLNSPFRTSAKAGFPAAALILETSDLSGKGKTNPS
jgi:hypothetical protein